MRGSSKLKHIGSWDCEFSPKIKIIHYRKLTDLDDQNSWQKQTGLRIILADFSENNRQLQFLQACPSPNINQDANPPHCLQVHYIGRVIPSPSGFIQLSEHIESSAHAEVYKICYLDTWL